MAVNLIVSAHKHRWHLWFQVVPRYYSIVNGYYIGSGSKLKKAYKCFRCLAVMDDASEVYMKDINELYQEYKAMQIHR